MAYHFHLTREQYLDTLKLELKNQRRDPLHLLVSFLLTVVQFAWVVFLLTHAELADQTKLILALVSAALFCGTLWWNLALSSRAKRKLHAIEKAGYLYQDFASLIRIKVDDGVLNIYGGKNKLSYDCAYLRGFSFVGEMLALVFSNGQAVHRILIPISAFGGRKEAASFAGKLEDIGAGADRDLAEAPDCVVEYISGEKDFVSDYIRGCRTAYRTSYMLTNSFLLKILLAVFLVWCVCNGSISGAVWQFSACLAAILLLSRLLIVFSPLIRLSAGKYAENLFSGAERMTFRVTVDSQYLTIASDSFCNRFSLERVSVVEKTSHALYIYLRGGIIQAIPAKASDAHSLSRCYVLLQAQAEKNKLQHKKFSVLRRRK